MPFFSWRTTKASAVVAVDSETLYKDVDSEEVSFSSPNPALSRILDTGRALTVGDFDFRATVGTGTFGRVRLVKLKSCEERIPYALKIMKKSEIVRLKQVTHIRDEKDILNSIQHPFIVNLWATFQDKGRLYMLMEFVNGGELFTLLRKESRIPVNSTRFYASELVLALQHLHDSQIVYRDLKPENLLLDSHGHLKIADFGFAKVVKDRTFTLCGTPEYLAPEIIQSKGHDTAVDWWALGILIYEMLVGFPPFYDENPFGIYQKILEGRIEFPMHVDPLARSLISKLLTADRTKRLGCLKAEAEDIKRHKFFKAVDWKATLARAVTPPFVPPVRTMDDCCMFDQYPDSCDGVGAKSSSMIGVMDQILFEGF